MKKNLLSYYTIPSFFFCAALGTAMDNDPSYILHDSKSNETNTEGEDSYKVARCYEKGKDCEINIEEAIRFYEKAIEKGHKKALYRLIDQHIKGNGLKGKRISSLIALAFELYHTGSQEETQKIFDLLKEENQPEVEPKKTNDFQSVLPLEAPVSITQAPLEFFTFPVSIVETYEEMAKKRNNIEGLFYTASIYRKLYMSNTENIVIINRAIKIYEDLRKKGHTQSIHNLAFMNWNGLGTAVNLKRAIILFEEAHQKGSDVSLIALKRLYEDNINDFTGSLGFKECTKKIKKTYIKEPYYDALENDEDNLNDFILNLFETDQTICRNKVEEIYNNPVFDKIDNYEAREIVTAACLLLQTKSKKKDEIIYLLEKAIEKGDLDAFHVLGNEYIKDARSASSHELGKFDFIKGVNCFKRGAEKGNIRCIKELKKMFTYIKHDLPFLKEYLFTQEEIINCLKKSANNGHVYSIRMIIKLCQFSPKFKETARQYLEKLVQLNNPQAMITLGKLYLNPEKNKPLTLSNLEKALLLFEKAEAFSQDEAASWIQEAKRQIEVLSQEELKRAQKNKKNTKNKNKKSKNSDFLKPYIKEYQVKIDNYKEILKILDLWKIDTFATQKAKNLISNFINLKDINSVISLYNNFKIIEEHFVLLKTDKELLSLLLHYKYNDKTINQSLIELRPLLKQSYQNVFDYDLWKRLCNGEASEMDELASELSELTSALNRFDQVLQVEHFSVEYPSYDVFFDNLVIRFKEATEKFREKFSPLYKELAQVKRTQYENTLPLFEEHSSSKTLHTKEKEKKVTITKQPLSTTSTPIIEELLTNTSGLCSDELIEELKDIEEKHNLGKKELLLNLVKRSHSITELLKNSTDGLYIHTLTQSAPQNCVWISIAINGKKHKDRLIALFDVEVNRFILGSLAYGNYHKK